MLQFGLPDSNDNVLKEGNKYDKHIESGPETRLVDA